MQLSAENLKRVLDNLPDGVYFVDRDRVIRYWNVAAAQITGFSAAEVVGRRCRDNILNHVDGDGTCLCDGNCPVAQVLADGKPRTAEAFLHHKNGHRVPVGIRVNPVRDREGAITGAVELFSDISAQAAMRQRFDELQVLAMYDTLTRLPNRAYIENELGNCLSELSRHGWPCGIILADIDHFKAVNDAHGHEIGDRVLQMVATTLRTNSRPFDVFGRWGGDEFVGIFRRAELDALPALCERLRHLVACSFILVKGEKTGVTISCGATLARPGDNVAAAVARADNLLYASKKAGRNRVTVAP